MSIDLRIALTRKGASQRLRADHGLAYTAATLANMATDGEGPVYRLVAGRAVYLPDDVDSWAATRIGKPVRRAADARRARCLGALVC